MGRRSINTTKSGKYMNPTDQARKEARKQELKKNKKQRQMVRAAVLKGKDPQQILEEMEKIDQMEYNVNQPSPLNEKVLKDKRKKLRDTLDRVLSMYYKDDPEKWSELRKRQSEYEHKRNQLVSFYESVKSAQQVTVDEIPLPQLPQQTTNSHNNIPLPTTERKPEPTIYSIATALKLQALGQPVREPPGCPTGPPPDINDEGDVEDFAIKSGVDEEKTIDEETDDTESTKSTRPTSLQQKMVALSGQNVDEFMKEMETVQKKLESGKDEERNKLTAHVEPLMPPGTNDTIPTLPSLPPNTTGVPPPLMFGGPGLRLPPGPPPGRPLMPPGPPPGLPPRLPLRLPTGGPRLIRLPGPPLVTGPQGVSQALQPNVLSAAPQLISRNESTKQGATISAKPQIRNLSADVTRFVPSTLRVKREEKKSKPVTSLARELKHKEMIMNKKAFEGQSTKDDAYKQFMQEMEGLM